MNARMLFVGIVLAIGAAAATATHPQAVRITYPLFTVSGKQQADNELLRQLLEEVRGLRRDIAQLKGGAASTAPKDFYGVITQRCASCHRADVAATKGGKLVLLEVNGDLPPFSVEQAAEIIDQVKNGSMPPKQPLPDPERKLVLEGLLSPKGE